MGNSCSTVPAAPSPTASRVSEETLPEEECEDPRAVFLTAIMRLARTAQLDYPEHKVREFCASFEDCFESIDFVKGDTIFMEGDEPDGIYVVIKGELCVFDADKKEEVVRIFKKDFFFDVEIVYKMACNYTTKACNACTVYKVPTSCVHELLKDVKTPHILQWYVRRRYPPNLDSLKPKIVYKKICTSVMQQVPLFSRWQESTVEAFIEYMGKTPMVLYRQNTHIIHEGDQGGDMLLLIRGSLNVQLEEDSFIIEEDDEPVVFGEEGVFSDGWKYKFSIIADAPCYVIIINKHWIWHASDNVWEFAEGAEPHWTNTVKKWQKELQERNNELYTSKYAPYLSIELLYQWLRCTSSFKRCSAVYVYELAKCGDALVLQKDGFFNFRSLEKGCLLVLKGELQLVNSNQLSSEDAVESHHIYYQQELVYHTNTKQPFYLQARTECLLVRFSKEDILNEMRHFHKQPINFLFEDCSLDV